MYGEYVESIPNIRKAYGARYRSLDNRGSLSSELSKHYDVVVIGAGIVGLTAAYHIKKSNPNLSVLAIDRRNAAAQGDTSKSAGGFRDIFTSEVSRLIAKSSIDFYRHVQSEVGFNLNLELVGYLYLMTQHEFSKFELIEKGMREQGIRLRIFERDQLADLVPDLVLDPSSEQSKIMGLEPIYKAVHGLDCGTVAPDLVAKFYETEFKRLNGELLFGTEVKTLRIESKPGLGLPGEPYVWQDATFSGVETNNGFIKADSIIVATGSRTSTLLDPLGIDCLTKPKKRQTFQVRGQSLNRLLETKGFNDLNTLPFTFTFVRGAEVYMRPVCGEKSFWVGVADNVGRRFLFEDEPNAEESYYTYNVYPVLSEYFPCFTNIRPVNSWAGHYDINTLDGTPIVDKVSNCVVATGTSGSGIMKADAVGRIAAAVFQGNTEVVLFGNKRIETSRFGLKNRAIGREEFVF